MVWMKARMALTSGAQRSAVCTGMLSEGENFTLPARIQSWMKEVMMEGMVIRVQLFDEGICRVELPRMSLHTKVYCNDECLFSFAPSMQPGETSCESYDEPTCTCAERSAGATGGCQFPLERYERLRIDVYDERDVELLLSVAYILAWEGLRPEAKYVAARDLDVQVISSKHYMREHAFV
jgi:hypothetical protein